MSPQIALFAAGSNSHGQLGIGSTDDAHRFTQCLLHPTLLRPKLKIVSGANHSLLLILSNVSHQLYGTGDSSKGQLPSSSSKFVPIDLDSYAAEDYDIKDIAAAWETSYILLRHRRRDANKPDLLLSIGADEFGLLGDDNLNNSNHGLPTGVKSQRGQPQFHVVQFHHLLQGKGYNISRIEAGIHHVVVLLDIPETGEQLVVGWGASRHGQLGPNATILDADVSNSNPSKKSKRAITRPCKIAPSFLATPTLLFTIPATELDQRVKQIALGSQHTVLLHESGNATSWGSNRKHQLEAVDETSDVQAVGSTWNGTYLILSSPTSILATGTGDKGQLGRSSAGSSSSSSSTTVEPGISPVDLPSQTSQQQQHIQNLACGSEHVLALIDSTLWGWGWNEHGNLGQNHLTDLHIPTSLDPAIKEALKLGGLPTSSYRILDMWAGCGTSWVAVEIDDQDS